MRVTHVVAHAFGPFRGDRLDLAPGMTVVAGPNEAGKSTWHAALRLALTGLRRGRGRSSAADAALAEQHRPWDAPDAWEVEAGITLDDGRTVELRQDLDGKVACSAIDVVLGRDVSNEILDGTPDASRWLGLDRDSFGATVSVSQAQILAVADAADALQEQMQRAAATQGTDATAAQAIDRLAGFRRDAVGADTANAKGPLRAAKTLLAASIERRDAARSRHEEYLEQGARSEAAALRVTEARIQLDLAAAGRARQLAEESARRAERAAELAGRHPMRPTLIMRDESADSVAAAITGWERRPALPVLVGQSSEALEAELQRLPPPPVGDKAPDGAVLAAVRELDLAEEAIRLLGGPPPVHEQTEAEDEKRLRALARRMRAGESQPRSGDAPAGLPPGVPSATLAWRAALAGSLILLVAALSLAIAGLPLAGVALAVLGILIGVPSLPRSGWAAPTGRGDPALESFRRAAEQARLDAQTARQEALQAGLPADPDALDVLANRAVLAAGDREQARLWWARNAELEERLAGPELRLRAALAERGAVADGDPREAWRSYRTACERRATEAAVSARGDSIRRELAARRQAEEGAVAGRRTLADLVQAIHAAAEAVGIEHPDDDPEPMVERLRSWRAERGAALQANQTAIEEWRELESLLDGASLDDLAADAARRGRIAAQLEAAVHSGADMPSGPDLESMIERRRDVLASAEAESHELKGALESIAIGLPDVAEAEEAVVAASAELSRVDSLAHTVDESLRLLRSAQDRVHRDLAPILADAVRRWLPAVSGGAYGDVSVDPADLSIQVKETRTGLWRQARLLSEGTREQIYLLLRVAMAQHLVSTRETAPLILDEVTAQADGERREALLEVLHRLSAERQVILFSHDPAVALWAERRLAGHDDRLVRLPSLTRPEASFQVAARTSSITVEDELEREPAPVTL